MRAGLIAATILNSQRTKSSDRIVRWTDFFPENEAPEEPLIADAAAIQMKLGVWAEAKNRSV